MGSANRIETKKNRHLCFWITVGIIIAILAAAAICIPLEINLARNGGSITTTTTTTAQLVVAGTTTVATTTVATTTVAATTTTQGKYINCDDIDLNFV